MKEIGSFKGGTVSIPNHRRGDYRTATLTESNVHSDRTVSSVVGFLPVPNVCSALQATHRLSRGARRGRPSAGLAQVLRSDSPPRRYNAQYEFL